jgi:ribonuclease P/MRP protein subunit POP1
MPFFTSLIHTGTRIAGLRERAVQHFEGAASDGSFPEDYVTTSTYAVFVKQKAEEDRARWERTPPAKRFNYGAALGSTAIEDVWAPDWYRVLGLSPPANPASLNRSLSVTVRGQTGRVLIPTQPLLSSEDMNGTSETTDTIEVDVGPSTLNGNSGTWIQPWLFRGSDTAEILQVLTRCTGDDVARVLFDRLVSIRNSRGFLEDLKCSPTELWRSALIGVRVHMLARGSPEDLAIIYRVDREDLLDSAVMNSGHQEALGDHVNIEFSCGHVCG